MNKKVAHSIAILVLAGTILNYSNFFNFSTRKQYTVKKNDTFSEIYRKYAENNISYSRFKKMNEHLISSGGFDNIHINANINLPSKNTLNNNNNQSIEDLITKDNIEYGPIPKGFKIITLSNVAEGIYKKYHTDTDLAAKYLDDLIMHAKSQSVMPTKNFSIDDLSGNGLYLSHLNIILGLRNLIENDKKYEKLHKSISEHLALESTNSPTGIIQVYANMKQRWPSDQTTTLYSLFLYDKINHTSLSIGPIKKFIEYMNNNAMTKDGLYHSEITGSKTGKIPRGCALSWSVYYMSTFAPKEAKKLWTNYKNNFFQNYGIIAGFREWPKHYDGKQDIDSGPIIGGIGVAASAFGIRAAIAMEDQLTYFQLKNSKLIATTGLKGFGTKKMKNYYDTFLIKALEYNLDSKPIF